MWLHVARHAALAALYAAPLAFIFCDGLDSLDSFVQFKAKKFYSILGMAGSVGALEGIATLPG